MLKKHLFIILIFSSLSLIGCESTHPTLAQSAAVKYQNNPRAQEIYEIQQRCREASERLGTAINNAQEIVQEVRHSQNRLRSEVQEMTYRNRRWEASMKCNNDNAENQMRKIRKRRR